MKVLAPMDGSASSQSVIDALIGIQWHPGTEIKLLAVDSVGDQRHQMEDPTTPCTAAELCDGLVSELQQALPYCEVTFAIRQGEAGQQIVEEATNWNSTLVLLSAPRCKGLAPLLSGGMAQQVLNQSPCPVLVLKSEGVAEIRDLQLGFKTVMVTVDNSVFTRSAIQWLLSLPWSDDTCFKLMTVVESVPDTFSFDDDLARASRQLQEAEAIAREAHQELRKLADELATIFGGHRVSIHIGGGDPQKTILNAASSVNADLIVMGSHGRGGLKKLLIGSVSQAVALKAACAVAVVKGLAPAGASDLQRTGMFKKPVSAGAHTAPARGPRSTPSVSPRVSRQSTGVHIVPCGHL